MYLHEAVKYSRSGDSGDFVGFGDFYGRCHGALQRSVRRFGVAFRVDVFSDQTLLQGGAALARSAAPSTISREFQESLSGAHVVILLAMKNGAAFLEEQLQSYSDQTHQNWSLQVSDDGSHDGSVELVEAFGRRTSQAVILRSGPEKGPYANFLSLLKAAEVDAEFFAFSDQDDIWHERKLERALSELRRVGDDRPALYCSRTELIDVRGKHIGYSTVFKKKPSFQNALVQNVGGGNTMVFNRRARELLMRFVDREAVVHDWLAYLVVSAAGGTVIYDPLPWVSYRQHGRNLIGSNLGVRATMTRINMVLKGQWRSWNSANLRALESQLPEIPEENFKTLHSFIKLHREKRLGRRLWYLWKSGVYRQSFIGNAALLFATMARKL